MHETMINVSKECARCHTTENITKHHLHNPNDGTILYLCQSCHDKEHGTMRHEDANSWKRRIRRAKRRIKRDTKIIQESEQKLANEKGRVHVYPIKEETP